MNKDQIFEVIKEFAPNNKYYYNLLESLIENPVDGNTFLEKLSKMDIKDKSDLVTILGI